MPEKKKRIIDPKAIETARKNFCQVCGKYQEKGLHVHHRKTKGSGGSDTEENLVCLCHECHTKVHAGTLKLEYIVTVEIPPLEEILQVFVNARESEDESKWNQAAALTIMRYMEMMPKQISVETGMSPANVREYVRTFIAFSDPGTRVPTLTFYHHRLASKTIDPIGWINRAADEGWSTRRMQEEYKRSISAEAEKDILRTKAEKAVRLTKEILAEGGEIAVLLRLQLQDILKEERGGLKVVS